MAPAAFDNPQAWPDTGNADRREIEFRKWNDAARRLDGGEDRAFAEALPQSPAGRAMLSCIFGASPFLSNCLVREPAFLRRLWTEGPDRCIEAICAEIEGLPADAGEEAARRALRRARRRAALAVALADIAEVWTLEAVTGALSRLADASCSAALRVLLKRLADRGAIDPPNPENPEEGSGLIVLGLGKLGGRELNYSSDIDLIFLYDPDRVPARKSCEAQEHFLRLARWFIAFLSERTIDGMAFRVDLRLRPDPVSTPLVIAAPFAERYYPERGQTWERVALIKARPVAGDRRAAEAFLKRLAPFVWRRNLDFPAMRDLHDIKKRIDAQHGSGTIGAPGHNLKLGRGGIREIEFFAQVHQLIWGGKNHRLRTIPTCDSLRALTKAGHVAAETTEDLIDAYRFLRRAEHRVQMVADKQTHSLPKDPAEFETLSRFLGYPDGGAFTRELIACLRRVELQYETFFEFPFPGKTAAADESPAAAEGSHLQRMGFADPQAAARIVEKWQNGQCPSAQDDASREILQTLTSPLLIAVCGTTDPDRAIARFDRLFDGLQDGLLPVLSLFQANLQALENVAEIMVSAPAVNSLLAARPLLLETLVDPETDAAPPDRAALAADLAAHLEAAADSEGALDRLAEWVDRARFRVCAQLLFHSLDPLDAPRLLSGIADCALEALYDLAQADLAKRFGRVPGASAALAAVGPLASRALTAAAGLDLALLYDAPADARSEGPQPLAAADWFDRFLAHVLSALGGRRGIYQADAAALGNETGEPAAAGLASFDRFFRQSAGPRGRMALTRARTIAGDSGIAARLEALVRGASAENLDPRELRRPLEAASARLDEAAAEGPPALCRAGLDAVETLIQYLLLREPADVPAGGANGETIQALAAQGALSAEDAERLRGAWRLWTRIDALQTLIGGEAADGAVPDKLRLLFQSAADADSFEAFQARMADAAAAVREIYARLAP